MQRMHCNPAHKTQQPPAACLQDDQALQANLLIT
jgi:hypothetical protein